MRKRETGSEFRAGFIKEKDTLNLVIKIVGFFRYNIKSKHSIK